MKKLSVILLLAVLVSCHKEKNLAFKDQLTGTWELREHWFGFGGLENFPAGNSNRITFNNAGQYSSTGLFIGAGAYELSPWTNAWGMPGNLLKLNNLQQGSSTYSSQFEAHISNDTLRLDNFSTISDSPAFFYIKR